MNAHHRARAPGWQFVRQTGRTAAYLQHRCWHASLQGTGDGRPELLSRANFKAGLRQASRTGPVRTRVCGWGGRVTGAPGLKCGWELKAEEQALELASCLLNLRAY